MHRAFHLVGDCTRQERSLAHIETKVAPVAAVWVAATEAAAKEGAARVREEKAVGILVGVEAWKAGA